jgi:teichoic acid transport system permease protein
LIAFGKIVQENWQWRKQIGRLALFDLIKKSRGTVLSWLWLFVQPLVFVFVLWFVLEIGLRVGDQMDPPYYLWLIAGLIPWFFMREMLSTGSDVLHRYSYLVNKVKFPIAGIPTIHGVAALIVHMGLLAVLFLIYLISGAPLDLHLLQLPLIIALMFIFFLAYSLLASLLCALSKDLANFIKAFITPLFWLSGILFDATSISIEWIKTALLFNPITFFVTSFRAAFYDKTWIWDTPEALGAFGIVLLVTLFVMAFLYKRLAEEVVDAI